MTSTRSTGLSASTSRPSATAATPDAFTRTAADRLLFVSPEGRQASRPARPANAGPVTTRSTGRGPFASTTTSRAFRSSGGTRASNAESVMRRRHTRTPSASASHVTQKDDAHKRMLGGDCGLCHNARDWKIWDFDHARQTKFTLGGAHAQVKCVSCHKLVAEGTGVPALPLSCIGCHRVDDIHNGEYGPQCERCHDAKSWREIRPFGAMALELEPHQLVAARRGVLQ